MVHIALNQSKQTLRGSGRSSNQTTRKVVKASSVALLLILTVGGSVNIEASIRGRSIETWKERLEFLKESAVFGSLESISIITALGIFILEGHRGQQKMQHYMKMQNYMALAVLNLANQKGIGRGHVQVLQDLTKAGISLERYDLSHADLFGIQLQGVDLHKARLTHACLDESDLSGAALYQANLAKTSLAKANLEVASVEFANLETADLNRANLKGCGLLGANLKQANLRSVDLTDADLRHADLTEATLSQADLRGADLAFTKFMDADLTETDFRGVRNLEPDQVKHAKNWWLAKYDAVFWSQLGHLLPETPQDFNQNWQSSEIYIG
jgi:BTB/POZ domain-containing protein KCTD9